MSVRIPAELWSDLGLAFVVAVGLSYLLQAARWRGRTQWETAIRGRTASTLERLVGAWRAWATAHVRLDVAVVATLVALAALTAPLGMLLGPIGLLFTLTLAPFAGPRLAAMVVRRPSAGLVSQQVTMALFNLAVRIRATPAVYACLRDTAEATPEPLRSDLRELVAALPSMSHERACAEQAARTTHTSVRRMLRLIARSWAMPPDAAARRYERLASAMAGEEAVRSVQRGELASAKSGQTLVQLMIPALFPLMLMLNPTGVAFFWTDSVGKVLLYGIVLLWIGSVVVSDRIGRLPQR